MTPLKKGSDMTAEKTGSTDALHSLLGSVMTQDAGMLEVSLEHAHRVLDISVDVRDIDDVLKLFGWDRTLKEGESDDRS